MSPRNRCVLTGAQAGYYARSSQKASDVDIDLNYDVEPANEAQLVLEFPVDDELHRLCVAAVAARGVPERLREFERHARRFHSSMAIGSVPEQQAPAVAVSLAMSLLDADSSPDGGAS